MKTKLLLILCALGLSSTASAFQTTYWEEAARVKCRDGKSSRMSHHEVYVGNDVLDIEIQNLKARRGSFVSSDIRFLRGPDRAEQRASRQLSGRYMRNNVRTLSFRRARNLDTMYFSCQSLRRDKRSYLRIMVQKATRGGR